MTVSMKGKKLRRWLLGAEASALFFLGCAIYALSIGYEWVGAVWAWLSGAQWTVAAWLRSERRGHS